MNSSIKRYWNSRLSHRSQNCFKKKSNQKPNFKTVIEKHIQHAGIWFKSKRPQLHWIAKTSIVCFLVTNLSQLIALVMAKDDLKKLFAGFSILTFCAVGFLKLWSLVVYQKLWCSLITQSLSLENHQLLNLQSKYEYESEAEEDNDFSNHVHSYTNKFNNISVHLSRIYYFSVVIFMVSPFIEYGLYLSNGIVVPEYPHILPGLAPLDINIFSYSATIITEAIAAVYCVTVHKVFDLTVIGLMIFIKSQFSLLHNISERIGGKGKKYVLSKKRDNRAHYRITNCHHIHVSLVKMVNELCNLIQNILGIYFFVATLTLCSVAVQLQWEDLSAVQIISLLQYMSAILTQLYIFCHYGNAMFNQIVRAAYSTYAVLKHTSN